MQRVKEKAIQLLQDQIVDRVIGWRAGEFFYDLTPSVFTSVKISRKISSGASSPARICPNISSRNPAKAARPPCS